VDALGGMDIAMEHMKDLSGIKGKLKLVDATSKDKGVKVSMNSGPLMNVLPIKAMELISSEYMKLYEMWEDFSHEKALMLSPYAPQNTEF
jgi:hypothetical protein